MIVLSDRAIPFMKMIAIVQITNFETQTADHDVHPFGHRFRTLVVNRLKMRCWIYQQSHDRARETLGRNIWKYNPRIKRLELDRVIGKISMLVTPPYFAAEQTILERPYVSVLYDLWKSVIVTSNGE